MRPVQRVTTLICLVLFAVGVTNAEGPLLSTDAEALLESSRRAYANDKFDDAVKFAKKATKLEPDVSVCQLWLGIAYSEKTQSGWFGSKLLNARRCRKAFERAVELDSSSLDAREGLIEFHVRAPGIAGGSMETAWEQVEFIMQRDSMRGYLAAAYIHERKEKDTSAAETAFLSAVLADTTRLLAQLRLAGFYVRLGEFDKADSVLTSAAESGDHEALLNLGWLHLRRGNVDEANGVFESVLRADSGNMVACIAYAEVQILVDSPSADSLITQIGRRHGECAELFYLSGLQAFVTARPRKSIDEFFASLKTHPVVQYNPCWSYPHLIEGVYSHRPFQALTSYRLGSAYLHADDKRKKARGEFERALKLDPTFWLARSALDRDNER